MERARIFHAEDNSATRSAIAHFLSLHDHEVVLQAENLAEAFEKIKKVAELKVSIAIVDGNLSPGDTNCDDGRILSTSLKEALPGITIIANTSVAEPGYGDLFLHKQDPDAPNSLLALIASVEEPS